MPIYLIAAAAGLLIGLILTQRVSPLLFKRVRGLYLLVPAVFAALAPYWLNQTMPERIWSADRSLYLQLLTVQQGCLILILLINLLPRHMHLPRSVRVWLRRQKAKVTGHLAPLSKLPGLHPGVKRIDHVPLPATRWWHRLPMLILLVAVALQTAVLFRNQGYMPLTRDYLLEFTNPALIAGIENGALLTKRLLDDLTYLPQLAQSIRIPYIERVFPDAFPYYSPVQLLGAAGLFLFLVSQFIDLEPGTKSIVHKPVNQKTEAPSFQIVRIPADTVRVSRSRQSENPL